MILLRYFKQTLFGASLLLIIGAGVGFAAVQSRGGKLLSVQSGSMVPMLHKGDLVAVTHVPASQLAVGDVVTYISPKNKKQTVTHRIVQVPTKTNYEKFVVKGDANKSADAPVDYTAIVGKLDFHAPKLGYAVDFVRKPIGLLLLIYIPALMIIADEIKRLAKHYKDLEPYSIKNLKLSAGGPGVGTKAVVFAVVALFGGLAAVLPVNALLLSKATLTGNRISAVNTAGAGHVLIRYLEFECSNDNTTQLNRLPSILIYNPTNADIKSGNWYLQSSRGKLMTFPAKTIFDSKDDFDIEPDLNRQTGGMLYAGDFLGLYDAQNNLIDGISWGSDSSLLNPPLPPAGLETLFRRTPITTDTDTSNDWSVNVTNCTVQ